jgi:hypothetical protein
MSDLYCLTEEHWLACGRTSRATASLGFMTGGAGWYRVREPQWAALVRFAKGLWPSQDALKLREVLG